MTLQEYLEDQRLAGVTGHVLDFLNVDGTQELFVTSQAPDAPSEVFTVLGDTVTWSRRSINKHPIGVEVN